jgi:hypothetical protein
MRQIDIDLLKEHGWTVVCELPFEIENEECESKADGLGAEIILRYYQEQKWV